ncbi:MAG: UrcA family protein [Brevundimonas sp.]|jgi:UrcA family protein|uniref:UrcA family protein n=1 Tax=Brevundimonas sp. TaxID=1871086 RepID=UPI0017F4C3AA|nr:UrcA family protein [Brevundimonas sp.]MBA4803440.1 UrcA family protein [Brevundimonas sp.]
MTRTLLSLAGAALLYAAPAAAQDAVRVPFADLDLSTGAGAAAFDARAAEAARNTCRRGPSQMIDTNCVRILQREIVRQLPRPRQEDYARARRGERLLAMAAPAWPA